MQRCLDLAVQGLGNTAPNPMVGCLIVHDGKIIGEGYHKKFGESHAEVNAIQSVQNPELLQRSTLYVNLEPCSHFGKTPPCTDLILQKNIFRVVIGSFDTNPNVPGKGIQKLKDGGVEVITKVLRTESDFLNRRFLTFYNKQRPYIILKWAQSADGFMALNEQKQFWFTNSESRKIMHKWRTEEQGILVGNNTIRVDDSALTARLWSGKNPTRIVIDRKKVLPLDMKVFNGEAVTLVFNEIETQSIGSTHFIKIDYYGNILEQILNELYKREIQSVIVEGGPTTLNHFIHQNRWDEARIFTTKHELIEGKLSPRIKGSLIEESEIETDNLKIFINPAS